MKNPPEKLYLILSACVVIGGFVDFFFNGVTVNFIFHSTFKEDWIFIYAPFELAMAGTLSTFLAQSQWSHYTAHGVIAFILGAVIGHSVLADHHSVRVYNMTIVSETLNVLLKSNDWPQILFITGENFHQELHHSAGEQIPVSVSVVTDYGCIRTAVVSRVAEADVSGDSSAFWTWRLNRFATTKERNGPGQEDLRFFWCKHIPPIKAMEDGPEASRPWDALLQKTGP